MDEWAASVMREISSHTLDLSSRVTPGSPKVVAFTMHVGHMLVCLCFCLSGARLYVYVPMDRSWSSRGTTCDYQKDGMDCPFLSCPKELVDNLLFYVYVCMTDKATAFPSSNATCQRTLQFYIHCVVPPSPVWHSHMLASEKEEGVWGVSREKIEN